MTEYFELGRVLKPQGVRGEVKAALYTDDPDRVYDLPHVYVESESGYRELIVKSARTDGRFGYLMLDGITDRSEAEALRDAVLYIDRANAAPLPEGAFYIQDLLGVGVYDQEGRLLGKLTDILQTGAKDIYVVQRSGGGTMMFPAVEDVFRERNPERGIILDGKRLAEVADYDN